MTWAGGHIILSLQVLPMFSYLCKFYHKHPFHVGVISTLTGRSRGLENEVISQSHTAFPGPGRTGTGILAPGLSPSPRGPYLALQETRWDDLGRSQENDSWAAGPPPWARPGVTQALAVCTCLEGSLAACRPCQAWVPLRGGWMAWLPRAWGRTGVGLCLRVPRLLTSCEFRRSFEPASKVSNGLGRFDSLPFSAVRSYRPLFPCQCPVARFREVEE